MENNFLERKESGEGIYQENGCLIVVCKEPIMKDGGMGWHLSISKENCLPSYDELKNARYKYCPNEVYMAQIFPPKEEFVNIHPYCIHLYEI